MVSKGVKLCLKSNLKVFDLIKNKNVVTIRHYSVYPPNYHSPIFRKEDQAAMELTGEFEALAHTPMKPAMLYVTCSEFFDPTVLKFTNYLMRKGNKALATSLIEESFRKIKMTQLAKYHQATPEERNNIELDPIKILHKAIENTMPVMNVFPIKKGGATYQVPVPITEKKQRFMAMNWILQAAKEKDKHVRYTTVLAKEILDAANNEGRVVKKKQDLHKHCEQNRAYAHFRWT